MADVFEARINRLRRGDGLRVKLLSDLAPTLSQLRERLKAVHDRGGYVVETQTGRRSDRPEVADMVLDAADLLRKGPPASVSRANGAKGGRKLAYREMPKAEAKVHWFSREHATNADALKHMLGWTHGAAHRAFGSSKRVRPGRPRKAKR